MNNAPNNRTYFYRLVEVFATLANLSVEEFISLHTEERIKLVMFSMLLESGFNIVGVNFYDLASDAFSSDCDVALRLAKEYVGDFDGFTLAWSKYLKSKSLIVQVYLN